MAEEEREKNRDRQQSRSDDRGPPPVANSRFGALAGDGDRRDDRGPPPVANSRFGALAGDGDRRDDRGPPPVANSRFGALAGDGDRSHRDDRGPPPVANSRFAAAAAMAEQESGGRREDRGGRFDRNDDKPLPQNSRFAAAAAADADYVPHEEREQRRMGDRNEDGRSGGRDDYDRRGGGGGGGGFRGDGGRGDDRDYESRPAPRSRVNDLLKPKAPAAVDNILKAPSKPKSAHEENMFKVPTKSVAPETPEKQEPKAEEPVPEPEPSVPLANIQEMLAEFASGNKLGDDLKAWCEERSHTLPPVDKLVFHMLTEREKLNPDVECGWASPEKYGAALASLVEDDVYAQMRVLWGIQFYCDKLGFPKLNEEYVVQSMFRSMYKFDIVLEDAFTEWKEDEADEHEQGKMKAIIQTVDWFAWLEADDEEEEEDEEEEAEEE
jgi:hypothetical protein